MPAASHSLISDDDLSKALAEIESEPSAEAPAAPQPPIDRSVLPHARTPASDATPEALLARGAASDPAPAAPETAQALDAQLAAAGAEAGGAAGAKNKRRFTISRKSGAAAKAAAAQATEALAALCVPATEEPAAARPSRFSGPLQVVRNVIGRVGRFAFGTFDRVLESLNKPIARLDGTLRLCIGFSGFSAGLLAVILMVIAPSLRPKRDAISFVHEKRYLVEHPRPKPAEPEPEAVKGEHKSEPAAAGHEESGKTKEH